MPTSSAALAARSGRSLNAKVLGQAPVPKPAAPAARVGWPPKDNLATGHRKDRNRGPGKPPKGGLALDESAPGAADPVETKRGDVTYEAQVAALQRELDAIRNGGASIRDSQRTADKWMDSLPSWPPPTPPAPEPVDRERERLRKRVDDFEATLVTKLIARTPPGPEGAGALKTLTKAFYFFDQEKDGTVDLPEFTRVLAKLGCVTTLPPSEVMRPLVQGLFDRYASNGLVHYREFAVAVLRKTGARMPAADAVSLEEARQDYNLVAHPWTAADDWHYTTAVRQALARRNLDHSQPVDAHQMRPQPRAAWEPRSVSALAADEGLAYRIPPRSEAEGAAMRGRLPGGPRGNIEARRLEEARQREARQARAQHDRRARAAVEIGKQADADVVRGALAGWGRKCTEEERLEGLTPGQYGAMQRRRKSMMY